MEKNGAQYLRDLTEWMSKHDSRIFHNKSVNEIIKLHLIAEDVDPNHYTDNGSDFMGFTQ